jgi:hypothetical protein
MVVLDVITASRCTQVLERDEHTSHRAYLQQDECRVDVRWHLNRRATPTLNGSASGTNHLVRSLRPWLLTKTASVLEWSEFELLPVAPSWLFWLTGLLSACHMMQASFGIEYMLCMHMTWASGMHTKHRYPLCARVVSMKHG